MKKFLMLFASVAFALVACEPETVPEDKGGGDDSGKTNPPVEEKVDFKISSDLVVNLGTDSEIYTLKFTAPEAWTASVEYVEGDEGGYVVLSKESGDKGENEVKVTVQSLPEDFFGRYFYVNLKCGSNSGKITVFQGSVFIVSESWFDFGTEGGKAEFSVFTNVEYSVKPYNDAFPWAGAAFDQSTGKGGFNVEAYKGYDDRLAYMKFTVPAIQIPVFDEDEEGNIIETGETEDYVVRVYASQAGNVKVAWQQDFFWGMFSNGARHSIALLGDYFIINAPIDAENGTGGLMIFKKNDGSYITTIDLGGQSFTGITTDDAGNIILTAGGDFPLKEDWSLDEEAQTPLMVFVITKQQALSILGGGEVPSFKPVIYYPNMIYGYGLDNVRVTGDITGTAVLDMVSSAYQEEEKTNRVASWQFSGGKTTNEPTAIRTVPADMSIWTSADLVAKHITNQVNGPLYYMGYDANYQLWYAANMEAEWQAVMDSGSTWVEGYQSLDIIEWNGHKYLGLIGETYFAWYGWGSLPSYVWVINIDDPTNPEPIAKTPCDISGNEGTWQYGLTSDLEMAVEGNDLAVYCVDSGVSTYHKLVYPAL
ncbi:MAG: hypothetical protein J6W94_02075 [Bacteroidales bacterium]|nr:hypothetical protein [Bacteroidales bacterium]